nr:unnamed protein product [Digitaria exilis]
MNLGTVLALVPGMRAMARNTSTGDAMDLVEAILCF